MIICSRAVLSEIIMKFNSPISQWEFIRMLCTKVCIHCTPTHWWRASEKAPEAIVKSGERERENTCMTAAKIVMNMPKQRKIERGAERNG